MSTHTVGKSAELDALVERSRRLGADPAVVNWKGGNTSCKCEEPDHTGRVQTVLWVKGSGSDLAAIERKAFTGLRLGEVTPLMEREAMSDEEMVDYLLQCMLHPSFPRPSIETLLHAFLPARHVDHTHPDAILAFCNAPNGEKLMKEAFGEEAVWVPYQRPGFALSKAVAQAVAAQPGAKAVFLAKHGLVTWGETSDACYESTLEVIDRAARFVAARADGKKIFQAAPAPVSARTQADRVMAAARGAISAKNRSILYLDDDPAVHAFLADERAKALAERGSACPDHLVHTKHYPLWLDLPAGAGDETLKEFVREKAEAYAQAYMKYVERQAGAAEGADDPYPRILLVPGVGLIATGRDRETARQAAGLYRRAIEVMRGAAAIDDYEPLSEADAYGVEYWPLERYKLSLLPPEQEFSRRVALITGAARGIGRAAAFRFAELGAHVAATDIDGEGAENVAAEICRRHGAGRALAVQMDVTDESAVEKGFAETVNYYGGIDVVVSNAGLAAADPVESTTVERWNRLFEVLVLGYFLVGREAFRVFKRQGIGGSLIFVTSKNALVAGRNASAYSAAKAAEQHLARSLAEEGGPAGIRVNTVAPDAVLEGSGIWSSDWRAARARDHGVADSELEDFYRKRTTLGVNVYPRDVAEAICFFAGDRSAKTTGCLLTVDGGVAAAYPR